MNKKKKNVVEKKQIPQCKYCKEPINPAASVCPVCNNAQKIRGWLTVGHAIEFLAVLISLLAVIYTINEASDAKQALAQTENLTKDFQQQQQSASAKFTEMQTMLETVEQDLQEKIVNAEELSSDLLETTQDIDKDLETLKQLSNDLEDSSKDAGVKIETLTELSNDLKRDSNRLTGIVTSNLNLLYSTMMSDLALRKKLLDVLCPPNTWPAATAMMGWTSARDSTCAARNVDFASRAVAAFNAYKKLSPAVAKNADINTDAAIKKICEYQPANADVFESMGIEVLQPIDWFKYRPEPLDPENIPSDEDLRKEAEEFSEKYNDLLQEWANVGTDAYRDLRQLCS